jgi:hypothetical protein
MSREIKIDNQLDNNLRQLKIGETSTPIELATDKIRINSSLELDQDLKINGDLSIGGSTSEINMSDGVQIETTTTAGSVGLKATALSVYSLLYDGDGSGADNNSTINLLPSTNYDAQVKFYNGSLVQWSVGNDGDDSDKLKFDVADNVGGATKLTLADNGDLTTVGDVSVTAAKKLYLDGGGDTYIFEHSADHARVIVGGDSLMRFTESGDDGNQVFFSDASVGFTQLEPSYGLNTTVDFRASNKQNLTFGSGNITNLNLYFPAMSGNFILLVKQDGTGSRTITNYKVLEFDESAADGEIAVVWAGGSAPTLTTDANHVDILSFYWDSDNEIAYGVATLDFQF